MALETTDLIALYRLSDSTNRKATIGDVAAMGGSTADLQDVCDNGSITTTGINAGGLNIGLVSTLSSNGDAAFSGVLTVNNNTSIDSTGEIDVWRRTATAGDKLQQWRSDVGSSGITVGYVSANGDATFSGDVTGDAFIGDGSQLTGLASSLQEVCDNGNTTTTGADFGGEVKINRPNDSDRAFVAQKAGVDKFVVTTQGAVTISGKLTAGIYDLESLPSLP